MKKQIKILILIIAYLLFQYNLISEDNYTEKYNISKQKYTIITLLDPISCIKCKVNIDKVISYINSNSRSKKYDILGFMRAVRKVEFNYYKKNLEWNYALFPMDNKFIKKLKINPLMDFILVSPDMKVVYQNNFSEYNDVRDECKKIIKLINN